MSSNQFGNPQALIQQVMQAANSLSDQEAARRSALERFGDGELAMMIGTRADVPALRESGVPFDVMPLPSFGSPRTVADIAGLCVDRRSDRLEDALDLVAFLAGDQGSTVLARSGAVVPANLDVAFSPVFAQRGQRPRSVQVFGSALARSGSAVTRMPSLQPSSATAASSAAAAAMAEPPSSQRRDSPCRRALPAAIQARSWRRPVMLS